MTIDNGDPSITRKHWTLGPVLNLRLTTSTPMLRSRLTLCLINLICNQQCRSYSKSVRTMLMPGLHSPSSPRKVVIYVIDGKVTVTKDGQDIPFPPTESLGRRLMVARPGKRILSSGLNLSVEASRCKWVHLHRFHYLITSRKDHKVFVSEGNGSSRVWVFNLIAETPLYFKSKRR